MTDLPNINLSCNAIQSIDPFTFNGLNLLKLELNQNQIDFIERFTFDKMNQLENNNIEFLFIEAFLLVNLRKFR